MIDRPVDITIPTAGRIDTTLRVLDSQAKVVATYNVSDLASDRFTVGYGHVVEVPSVVGKDFTVEARFHIAQQGQYLLFGDTEPLNDRYLFSGFSVSTTPVPEPGAVAVAMVIGGLAFVGFLRPRRRKKHLLTALLLTAGLASTAQAQDAVIASATLQISGLHYSLVDLDPNDGIAPSVSFSDALQTTADTNELGSYLGQTHGGAFPAPFALTSPSTLGQVTRTDDGFTVHTELRASDTSDPNTWPALYQFLARRTADVAVGSLGASSLTLSPHTQLVIEGTLTPTVSLDMSSLSGHPLLQDPNGAIQNLHGRSVVYLAYSAFEVGGTQMDEGSAHAALEQDAWRGATGGTSTDLAMPPAFSFGLVNDTATAMNGQVNWNAFVYTDVATGVPEPQTWVLTLAGMLIVPAARRAQKRQR